MSDKMVVIGKDSPRFQTPIRVTANRKQSTMKHTEARLCAKMMLFQVGANCQEIRAAHTQPMLRGMWPGRGPVVGHCTKRIRFSWLDKPGRGRRPPMQAR